MKLLSCIFVCVTLILFPVLALGADIHVPGDQPTIQQGIDAAVSGDTVIVADNTYTGDLNKNLDPGGKSIIIRSQNGYSACIIDCEDDGRGFHIHSGETTSCVIQGFTIQNGFLSTGDPDVDDGGGIFCQDASPTINNCLIKENASSYRGGGMYCLNSSAVISNCTISDNTVDMLGAGIFLNESPIELANCTIKDNTGGYSGGGIYNHKSASTIQNCIVSGNIALYGGGIVCDEMPACTIDQCTISDNKCDQETDSAGGGIFIGWLTSPVITNCTISTNLARAGGGVFLWGETSPIIGGSDGEGNTFQGNRGAIGADLCLNGEILDAPVNATFNTFSGYCLSDFYVSPQVNFDLSDCTNGITPITQDVYVSPSGDNTNDGLTWDTAFKTIQYAMGMICGDESNLLTVHLDEGIFSPSLTAEYFPLPVMNYVNLKGKGADSTILDAEQIGYVICASMDDHLVISDITVTGGETQDGGGIVFWLASPSIVNCVISGNSATNNGGGINCMYESSPEIINCILSDNTAAKRGGAVMSDDASSIPTLKHCTIAGNIANNGGAISCRGSTATIKDSILWGNTPDEIHATGSEGLTVTYSDVQGGYVGDGNIDEDPLFTEEYHLCATLTGDADDSPCIDTGSDLSENCFNMMNGVKCWMNVMGTRCDDNRDRAEIDMGYHYPSPFACDTLGCMLDMPSHDFKPGDECFLDLYICNPSTETYSDVPVFAILDVYGSYYFGPTFTEFDHYIMTIEPGFYVVEAIPQFFWPADVGSASGLYFHAAMTNPEISDLFGTLATFEFGWGN